MILKILGGEGRIVQLHSIPVGGVSVHGEGDRRRVTFNPAAMLAVEDDLHAVVLCTVCSVDQSLMWVAPPSPAELVQALTGWQGEHLCEDR